MSLNPLFRTDYLLFWGLVIILMGALFAWLSTRRVRLWLRLAVVVLRVTALALIALIALNFGRWVSPPAEGQPFAAVLLDRSSSMATPDVDGDSRWDAARQQVLAARAKLPDPDSVRLCKGAAHSVTFEA